MPATAMKDEIARMYTAAKEVLERLKAALRPSIAAVSRTITRSAWKENETILWTVTTGFLLGV
jgi:hypothetical protein